MWWARARFRRQDDGLVPKIDGLVPFGTGLVSKVDGLLPRTQHVNLNLVGAGHWEKNLQGGRARFPVVKPVARRAVFSLQN